MVVTIHVKWIAYIEIMFKEKKNGQVCSEYYPSSGNGT